MWQMLAGLALNKLGAKNQQSNQLANNFTPDVNERKQQHEPARLELG